MTEFKCEVCGQGPSRGVSIYRTGGKGPGVNPKWRCEPHMTYAIPQEVAEVVAIIESDNRTKQ